MSLQLISIILEAIIALIFLFVALKRNRLFAYGFSLTFLIYVFYDSVQFFSLPVSGNTLYISFFLATVSSFCGAILLYLEGVNLKKRRK